jgi:hypothetical protein
MKVTAASHTAIAGKDARDVALGLRRVGELLANFGQIIPSRHSSGYRCHRRRNGKRGKFWQ